MKLVIRIIRFSPRQFGALLGWAVCIFAVIPVPLGLVTRDVFDSMVHRPVTAGVWTAIGVLAGLQVSLILGELGLAFPWSSIQQRTHTLLQHNLMAGVLSGYGRHGLTQAPAAAIARFRDEPGAITSGSLDAVCDLIGRVVFAVVAGVVMWRIDPLATVAAFAPIVVTSVVTDALGTRAAVYGAAARQSTTRVSGFVGELLAGHLAVTVGGSRERALARLGEMADERRRLGVRDTVFTQVVNSMNFHVVNVGTGVVMLVVASAVRSGRFSVGDLALFTMFLDQLTYLPAEIGRLITEVKQTDKALERMHAFVPGVERDSIGSWAPLGAEELRRCVGSSLVPGAVAAAEPGDAGLVPAGAGRDRASASALAPGGGVAAGATRDGALERLDVSGLTYTYGTSGRGVADVSFSLEAGSFTVVTGRIGSGKTTLLHCLLGLLPADAGQVSWNGRPVSDPALFLVPPRVAFTPQIPRLFSESLRSNLHLGRSAEEEQLSDALHAAVLDPDMGWLEEGIDTQVGPRGVKLSGGQVQRAAAARMFLAGAELLVIDDLSSALDADTEAELWARLFRRLPAVTCLVVSHRPVALRRADQILTLENGRIVP